MVAIYHRVKKHEDFNKSARTILELVQTANLRAPNKDRCLYLDIDGHRNAAGGFDVDMFELQQDFVLGFLLPFLKEAHMPIISVENTEDQRNDIPDRLEIKECLSTT